MNTTLDKIDELNATLIIDLEKSDYNSEFEKQLKKLQQRLPIKGFRPGKAPIDMVKKMHGNEVLSEVVNTQVYDTLEKFIKEEKLDLLGYPLLSNRIERVMNFDAPDNFRVAFDLAFAPKFDININSSHTVTQYEIEVSDKDVDQDIEYARKRAAKPQDVDTVDTEDTVFATFTELSDDNTILEGGVHKEDVSFTPALIENEEQKAAILGKKVGDVLTVNIFQLFNNNDTVISSSLGIDKIGVADLNMNFQVAISKVQRRILPEINQEYFNEIYGEANAPKTIEEYRERVKQNLIQYYQEESNVWIDHEIGHLIHDNHPIQLPEEFLKRWLVETKAENYNNENIDEKFSNEKNALIRRLVTEKVQAEYQLSPTDEQIETMAYNSIASMFRQYGYPVGPNDEYIANMAKERLSKEKDFATRAYDMASDKLVFEKLKEIVTLVSEKVTVEEYFEKLNSHNKQHHH